MNAYLALPHAFAIGCITNAFICLDRCARTGYWLVALPGVNAPRTARCVVDDFGNLVEVAK